MSYRFGLIARAARESKGIAQEDLAAKIGMDRGYYSRLERGSPKNPGQETRERIAAGLGMTLEEMTREAESYIELHPYIVDRIVKVRVGDDVHPISDGTPVTRLQGLVQAVQWNQDREAEITNRLIEFIKADSGVVQPGTTPPPSHVPQSHT